MSKKVEIYEVGPRDGFQNISEFIPTDKKIEIIDSLVDAGLKHIQITSFVSPKAIPQLKDAKIIVEYALNKYKDIDLFVLIPNKRGAQIAYELGVRNMSVVVSLSTSHNKANIGKTHEQSFVEVQAILDEFEGVKLCVDIATAFVCPFEGEMSLKSLVEFVRNFYNMGIREFNICDTIGYTNPMKVREAISRLKNEFSGCRWQVHIHDTRGLGQASTLAAIEVGVDGVQTTLGGLGGCPFAPGAAGNTSTEDLVFMLESMGYDTGVDFDKLVKLAKYQKSFISGAYSSHNINIEKISTIY